jgi:DNA-directed RNA polymerase subunit RPC12/RpoP
MVDVSEQLALFDAPLDMLRLTPTLAMQRGEQRAYQCAQCGTVVVVPSRKAPEGACPACDSKGWWKQRFPLAGLEVE